MLSQKKINSAIDFLKSDKIVILPTDTIYGLSAIFNSENELRINKIKRSEETKKLIVLFSKNKQIKKLINLTKEFKVNLKSKEPITQIVNDKNNQTIALRKVKRKDLKKIINKTGPIFSTSVNYSGNSFLNKKEELDLFNIQVSEVFWDGELNSKPSKILDLVNKKTIRE
ncbi:L-threonylcarbamoyladenylate synthase [Spiroplasma sp. BIUS-1]|uniref:L-threonylcarbamoyladenylate synthase n=1 Tax=Spiroplasma sp. BIUS-1 TaxID=216964 RepID=UPI001397F240|nr:Sua5/YciO/YrdC/YwlC family protein [Spiroplasma sp. BIUS-1]QHX36950.1 tRNA threonylcarbamoyladenosine biosynthesis protein TsaC [Spiroplasma sp. BIUS-1]